MTEKELETYGMRLLSEMARESDSQDPMIIYIYSKEGSIPHFHFYQDEDELSSNLGGCIELRHASYFSHGNHERKLNSQEKKWLIQWLDKPHYKYRKYTNFEVLCNDWDTNNPDNPCGVLEKPDYRTLT